MLIHGIKKEGEGKKKKSCDGTLTITKGAEAPDFPFDSFQNITSRLGVVFVNTYSEHTHTHTLLHRQHLGTATSDSVEAQNHQLSSPNVDLFWAAGLLGFTLGLVAVISHISQP